MKRRRVAICTVFLVELLCVGLAAGGNGGVEEALGDALVVAGAAGAYLATFAMDDPVGRSQFYPSFALNIGATYTLKSAIDKPRRDDSGNDSFPSAHTSIAFHSASFLQRRYGWRWGIPAYGAAAVMGWSRVAVERHDGYDVLAGAAIGVASSYLFVRPWNGITLDPIAGHGTLGAMVTAAW